MPMVDSVRNMLGDNVIWNGFSVNGKSISTFPKFDV